MTTCGRHATTVVCAPRSQITCRLLLLSHRHCHIDIVYYHNDITISTLPHTATTRATVISCLYRNLASITVRIVIIFWNSEVPVTWLWCRIVLTSWAEDAHATIVYLYPSCVGPTITTQNFLRDVTWCCTEVPLPAKTLWMHTCSLEPRLSVPDFVSQLWRKIGDFSPKLRDKIRNREPGFEASTLVLECSKAVTRLCTAVLHR